MTYEPKPGTWRLFRNKRKTSPLHSDYTGLCLLPNGTEVEIAGWIRDGKDGKFLAGKLSAPLGRRAKANPRS